MIGSAITRVLVLAFGYLYPAYECYKSVELNKPNIEQLRFWCQYWILVAGLTICERLGDVLIGWVPMYGEAKLAFFVYLWFPKTKGTTYVYDSFRPYVAKHETEIDRSMLELRARVGDMALLYWQKAASYAQSRIVNILLHIASQSTPKRPAQPQQETAVKVPSLTTSSDDKPSSAQPDQDIQHSSPSSSSVSSATEHAKDTAASTTNSSKNEAAPSKESRRASAKTQLESRKSLSSDTEEQMIMQIDVSVEKALPPPSSLPMEEGDGSGGGRLTRARSRRTRGAAKFAKTG